MFELYDAVENPYTRAAQERSMSRLDRTLLVCPTLNPGSAFKDWLDAFDMQDEKPAEALIIDSASNDGSVEGATNYGFRIQEIDRKQFSHGGTRQKVVDENEGYEFLIFLTQDAVLADGRALSELLSAFDDPEVAAACGRQLPRRDAGPMEAHARLYNYPVSGEIRSIKDAEKLGIKAAFLSNSFAAYRREALIRVGGFPENVIFGEDMYVAAKLLLAGYKVAYVADACVYHSHSYTLLQEFKRYFDMGVFHAREPWIRQEFGGAEGEGLKFVVSELRYLSRRAFWRIPESVVRTVTRYAGFRLGLLERRISLKIKKKLSMNPAYFKEA